jgi:hypothetical protein
MKILISGSTGLIGRNLSKYLALSGHEIIPLTRKQSKNQKNGIVWNPKTGETDLSQWEGLNAIIHLAGYPIAEKRWSDEVKKKIYDSRVNDTKKLAENISKLSNPPQFVALGSAIGYYGDREDSIMDEDCSAGEGFLAKTAIDWENAGKVNYHPDTRIVFLRTGIVLSKKGGALDKMLLPFKCGVGGKLGDGSQYMSWIHIKDMIRAIEYLMIDSKLSGPVNMVAPNPVTNHQFTKALGSALKRPTIFSVPKFALKTMMGQEMSKEMLLASTRVHPIKLIQEGFSFEYSEILPALKSLT